MQKKRAELLVDFFPELTESELTAELVRRQEICPYKAPKELLIGLLPEKLIPVLIGKKKTPEEMAGAIKSYRLQITGQTDFGKAQVCAGGITLDQLTDSLESVQHPGIFFAGEAWTSTASAAATISSGPGPAEVQPEELQQENMHDSDTAIKLQSPTHRRNWNRK